MKYVSVDTETTGLLPNTHQILEMGFVLDDLQNQLPLSELPKLRVLLIRENYLCNPFAASMHSVLWKELAKHSKEIYLELPAENNTTLIAVRADSKHAIDTKVGEFLGDRITPAGKNFSSFDLSFMKAEKYAFANRFRHRSLDPGSLYATANDDVPPSLEECLKRANLEPTALHTSIGDALDVIRLLRHAFRSQS